MEGGTKRANPVSRWVRGVVAVLVLLSVPPLFGTLAGFLGGWWWGFDLFAHFRLQYAAWLGVAALVLLGLRRVRWAALLAAGFVINAALLVPLWVDADRPVEGGGEFRVLQMNVLTSNPRKADVLGWAFSQDADVVLLQEVDAVWAEAIDRFAAGYVRLDIGEVRGDNFGIAALVRDGLGVRERRTGHDSAGLPSVELVIDVDGRAVTLLGVHTVPPRSRALHELRAAQFDRIAERVAATAGPVVVVGDLNATRWSAPLRRLLDTTRLRDGTRGFGYHGTWSARLWFTAMIPIDHVLASPEVAVAGYRVGPDLGSDHRGVVADLVVGGDS